MSNAAPGARAGGTPVSSMLSVLSVLQFRLVGDRWSQADLGLGVGDLGAEDVGPHCFSVTVSHGRSRSFAVELDGELAEWEAAFQRATFAEVRRTGVSGHTVLGRGAGGLGRGVPARVTMRFRRGLFRSRGSPRRSDLSSVRWAGTRRHPGEGAECPAVLRAQRGAGGQRSARGPGERHPPAGRRKCAVQPPGRAGRSGPAAGAEQSGSRPEQLLPAHGPRRGSFRILAFRSSKRSACPHAPCSRRTGRPFTCFLFPEIYRSLW